MTILPILKLADSFAYLLFIRQCPWTAEETYFPARYLIMTLITVASIYQTLFLGIIWLLGKGWSLVYFAIDWDSAASITTAMGGIYIAYSALFVSLPGTFFWYFM